MITSSRDLILTKDVHWVHAVVDLLFLVPAYFVVDLDFLEDHLVFQLDFLDLELFLFLL